MGRPEAVPPEKGLLSSTYVNSPNKEAGRNHCAAGLFTIAHIAANTFGTEHCIDALIQVYSKEKGREL